MGMYQGHPGEEEGRFGTGGGPAEKHVVGSQEEVQDAEHDREDVEGDERSEEPAQRRPHLQGQGGVQDSRHDAGMGDEILEKAVVRESRFQVSRG